MQQKYRIGKVLSLAGLMFLANACHKDPTPEPTPTPGSNDTTIVNPPFNPEDTVTPWRKIVIDWDWDANIGWAPPVDSVKYWTDQRNVKMVYINITGWRGPNFPVDCIYFRPSTFHKARNALQPCINNDSTRVKLSNELHTPRDDFTSHDASIHESGITYYDKYWFETHGCTFVITGKSK